MGGIGLLVYIRLLLRIFKETEFNIFRRNKFQHLEEFNTYKEYQYRKRENIPVCTQVTEKGKIIFKTLLPKKSAYLIFVYICKLNLVGDQRIDILKRKG